MSTMLIAFNGTRENGNFMGDQLCYLKVAYLMVQNQPDVDRVIVSMSRSNEMDFVWTRFIENPKGDGTVQPAQVIYDTWHPGDWPSRWQGWDHWRRDRHIEGIAFDHYRELYLRIHGATRQTVLCGFERGLGRRNIYEYVYYGQEHMPEYCVGSDVYDCEIEHPPHRPTHDVYIAPHCKTQGNLTFTFDFWSQVVHKLIDAGVSVTVGYDGQFCEDLNEQPLYHKHWGTHRQWMERVCSHKLVACGNTGTGWLAAACGVPLITMEPHNSCMADHRYRECGLRNLVDVVDGLKLDEMDNDMRRVADYVAGRIIDQVNRKVVMTTGCYDVLHAGHVRHLERAKALGTRLVVALNSDESVRGLKGPSRPINPQDQRKAVLEALRCVDEVRVFDGADALPLLREVKPAVLACGYGYTPDTIVGRKEVEEWGGQVVVTCEGDAKDEPSTTKIVQRIRKSRDTIEVCRLGAAQSVNPLEKLRLIADEFLKVAHLDGDIADLGSYRGGSALVLRRLAPDKHLHLFDTWAGNPYDDDFCHHKKGEWPASLEDCKALVGADEYTHYHQGVFPEWDGDDRHDGGYRPAGEHFFCFVYVDMDTYQSTRDAIEFFWPRLVSGGILFFDDWGWEPCAGVKKAVDEAFGDGQKRVVQSLYSCVVEKS